MRKFASYLAPAVALALVLAACGADDTADGPEPGDDPVEDLDEDLDASGDDGVDAEPSGDFAGETVTMWFNGTPDSHGAVLEDILPAFEEETGITVDYEITNWDTYQQEIATAAAGGTLPDIIFGFSNLVGGFAERGILADHGEFFNEADFVPATVDLTTYDGTWSMIPMWFGASALSYRADLIEEAGFDPDTEPADWDELLEWAQGATTDDQLGFYSSSFGFNKTGFFFSLLEANGATQFSADGSEVAFNSPEGVEAAAFFQELSQCCDQLGAIEADNIGLGQGQTAMVYNNFAFRDWAEEFPDLYSAEIGRLIRVPSGPSGDGEASTLNLGANVIGVTSQANNPAAAAEVIRYFVLDEENIVRFAGLSGQIPASNVSDDNPYFDTNPFIGRYRELAVEAGRSEPVHPNFGEYDSIMQSYIEELLTGSDPQAVMDRAADEVQSEIIDRSGVPFTTFD